MQLTAFAPLPAGFKTGSPSNNTVNQNTTGSRAKSIGPENLLPWSSVNYTPITKSEPKKRNAVTLTVIIVVLDKHPRSQLNLKL